MRGFRLINGKNQRIDLLEWDWLPDDFKANIKASHAAFSPLFLHFSFPYKYFLASCVPTWAYSSMKGFDGLTAIFFSSTSST